MTQFQQPDVKVYKKVWANMEESEEMIDKTTDDDDIPMDEIRKKNIKIFKAQGKPTKFHTFMTNITDPKMPNCSGCTIHWVNFDGTWRDIDPCVIHVFEEGFEDTGSLDRCREWRFDRLGL